MEDGKIPTIEWLGPNSNYPTVKQDILFIILCIKKFQHHT